MANETKVDGRFFFTLPIRILHNNLFVAKAFKNKQGKEVGNSKFNADLAILPDHAQWSDAKKTAGMVARGEWPGRSLAAEGGIRFPWKSGDEAADKAKAVGKNQEFKRGYLIMPARTGGDYPPKLSAIVNGKVVDFDGTNLNAAQPHFWAGMDALAEVSFAPYTTDDGKDGVTCRLNHIVALGTGEKLQTGRSTSEKFSAYLGRMTTESPLGNSPDDDDEIPA